MKSLARFLTRPGQVLMLREAVSGFPRGTPVKVISVLNTDDPTFVVEPYLSVPHSNDLAASGVRLTLSHSVLAESLPEFRSGTMIS
ncbi:MAG: hypothetical protein ABSB34_12760 [Candidatus Limnocylindrales bacterium]